MESCTVDDSEFPLVVVRFAGTLENDSFRRYLEALEGILMRNERYAIIVDALRAGSPTAAQRRLQAEFIKEHHATLQRLCVAGAFVIDSSLIRGAMTAILWLSPMPFPYHICRDLPGARDWVRERMRSAGLVDDP